VKLILFSAHAYDRRDFDAANQDQRHQIHYVEPRLDTSTVSLAQGWPGVCCFVNDSLDSDVLRQLHAGGTRLIALRCAGFNQVDLKTAAELGLPVVRVPAYSPHAVAEHAVGLILTLNRKFHRAYNRTRENNFRLGGLEGFDIYGKTVGVVGTGRIGATFARIMLGFGCTVLAFDPYPDASLQQAGVRYESLDTLLSASHIVSLHCPLTPDSHHLINAATLERMKDGAMLINTSRGGLLDTRAVITALKHGKLGALGLDVYEQEGDLFFKDLSDKIIDDDVFQRLLTFPNVIVTGHQAFFTHEALTAIAQTTLGNIDDIEAGRRCANQITLEAVKA